uniref:TRAF-type domain-containing protein n=1 Tax=Haptolina ericina TaxID=156174 RepID=A0A7S3C4Z8_9EUKA
MSCPNAGCVAVYSARSEALHDAQCPFKLLPCALGCEERVMRSAMDAHTSGPCPRKPVDCPFKMIGCYCVDMTQGELPGHLVAAGPSHQLLMLAVVTQQQQQQQQQSEQLITLQGLLLEQRAAMEHAQSDFSALEQQLRTSEEHNAALRKELESTLKQGAELAKAQTAHAKRAADADVMLGKLSRQIASLEKEARGGLGKAASEREGLAKRMNALAAQPGPQHSR